MELSSPIVPHLNCKFGPLQRVEKEPADDAYRINCHGGFCKHAAPYSDWHRGTIFFILALVDTPFP